MLLGKHMPSLGTLPVSDVLYWTWSCALELLWTAGSSLISHLGLPHLQQRFSCVTRKFNSVMSASSECKSSICSLFCGSNPMWCAESATALAVHSPSDPLFFCCCFVSYHEKQTHKHINKPSKLLSTGTCADDLKQKWGEALTSVSDHLTACTTITQCWFV